MNVNEKVNVVNWGLKRENSRCLASFQQKLKIYERKFDKIERFLNFFFMFSNVFWLLNY